jgi:hypothetical protein
MDPDEKPSGAKSGLHCVGLRSSGAKFVCVGHEIPKSTDNDTQSHFPLYIKYVTVYLYNSVFSIVKPIDISVGFVLCMLVETDSRQKG